MLIKEAITYGLEKTKDIEDKKIKIEIILSNLLNVKREYLITHDVEELSKEIESKFIQGINLTKH